MMMKSNMKNNTKHKNKNKKRTMTEYWHKNDKSIY